MSTPLMAEFPELAHLSREELEDLLNDPVYFQAIFHSLDRVKALYQSQSELGLANEAIAKHNLTLQGDLYKLRSDTKDAFDEAKALEARWKEVEREQREVYQVHPSIYVYQDEITLLFSVSRHNSSSSASNIASQHKTKRQRRLLQLSYTSHPNHRLGGRGHLEGTWGSMTSSESSKI